MNSQSPIHDFKTFSKQRKTRKERKNSIPKQETGFTLQMNVTSVMDIPAQIMEAPKPDQKQTYYLLPLQMNSYEKMKKSKAQEINQKLEMQNEEFHTEESQNQSEVLYTEESESRVLGQMISEAPSPTKLPE